VRTIVATSSLTSRARMTLSSRSGLAGLAPCGPCWPAQRRRNRRRMSRSSRDVVRGHAVQLATCMCHEVLITRKREFFSSIKKELSLADELQRGRSTRRIDFTNPEAAAASPGAPRSSHASRKLARYSRADAKLAGAPISQGVQLSSQSWSAIEFLLVSGPSRAQAIFFVDKKGTQAR